MPCKTSLLLLLFLVTSVFAAACPANKRRAVTSLNKAAADQAHPRDNTATRAFSNIQIKTSDGQCLRVDKLSGDFRANLTPIQIVECGTTDGQGWDIITSGVHNDQKGQILIVSTLTQACFNFDSRRPAGNQVNLFSCGGRADGGGQVTSSQLFAFNGGSGPLSLKPQNDPTKCLVVNGETISIADCNTGSADQSFTFGNSAGGSGNSNGGQASSNTKPTATRVVSSPDEATATSKNGAATSIGPQTTAATSRSGSGPVPSGNPTSGVPVSRAGGTLNPSAAAESNQFDDTATRAAESINIRAADGRCLSIDPTAGDFRENLIPVQLAECSEAPNQKFDIVTKGEHNDGNAGDALLVSVLTNGCLNFDNRRPAGDTVILFSCGGRADGSGQTATSQLFPFMKTSTSIVLAPASGNGQTCFVAGTQRLESMQCNGSKDQAFQIVDVL